MTTNDLISRQAVVDAIEKYWITGTSLCSADYAIGTIKTLPSADRPKGEWNCGDDMFEYGVCSVCKWDSGEAWENTKKWWNFCPNCGAKMGGDTT